MIIQFEPVRYLASRAKRPPRLLVRALVAAAIAAGLIGCDGSKASAASAARAQVGDPNAKVEAMRVNWTPTYQKAVCGRVEVGLHQRRFVALLTSGGKAVSAMVEKPDDSKSFEEVIWVPICGF